MANEVKQFLDKAGVETLWDRIYNGFAPRWQSYKPSNTSSSDEDKLPADFINTYESDHIVNGDKDGRKSLNVTFVSAGAIKDAEGNKYGRDLVIQIPEVKAPSTQNGADGAYGVMSPADKWKLDNVANTAEDKVTIKGVKVNNAGLTIDNNKLVNWDLHYDESTNELQIIDLNNSLSVLSRVDMDSVLPDVITKGFLQNAEIKNVDDKGNDGLFLKLTFATSLNNGEVTNATDVYINVNDLIDVYNAGTGISITQSTAPTADGQARISTIDLKTAQVGEIGGIKVKADNSTTDNNSSLRNESNTDRDFGVVINKDDVAYVNIPVTTINVVDSDIKDDAVEIVSGTDKIQILKGYAKTANGADGWTLTPQYSEISFGKESDISISGDEGNNTQQLKFGDSFDILRTITASGTNNHTITRTKSTLTLPEETKLSLSGTSDENNAENTISIMPSVKEATIINANGQNETITVASYSGTFDTTRVSGVSHHNVVNTKTSHSFDIQIPAIEASFIDNLVYRVR